MFKQVTIVGVGLIGGSLGLALRERRLAERVVGVGRTATALETATTRGAIDSAEIDLAAGVRGADLVVLATPVQRILADLQRLHPILAPSAIVTDVGSAKAEIVAAAEMFLAKDSFVGGHPMAGSEKSGVESARVDLFNGAIWAFTPTERTDATALARVSALAEAVGARTLCLSPDDHDRAVAVTSHLPHVAAYAMARLGAAVPFGRDLAAGSFASATRVAASSPELWQEIALTNRNALTDALRTFQSEIDRAIAALDADDGDTLLDQFRAGYDARRTF